MSRGMQDFDGLIAQLKTLPIFREMDGEVGFRTRPIDDRSARCFCQIQMAAHKIGMEMCLEDVFDLSLALFREFQIDIDIAQGIDDNSLTLVIDVVSGFTQTAGI